MSDPHATPRRPVAEGVGAASAALQELSPQQKVGVVIVAAGQSSRMSGVDKIFAPLLGIPLIAHAVEALEASPLVSEMVLVLSADNVDRGRCLSRARGWKKLQPQSVCAGGARRQDSVQLGLERLSSCSWVAVHDGARPCIEAGVIESGVRAAQATGAAVAAVPAKDTIKVVSEAGTVQSTPPRESLWLIQTPQVFLRGLLREAHLACRETVTDDASMVEWLGHEVRVFMGSYANLKVTTPEDLNMAEVILRRRAISDQQPVTGGQRSVIGSPKTES